MTNRLKTLGFVSVLALIGFSAGADAEVTGPTTIDVNGGATCTDSSGLTRRYPHNHCPAGMILVGSW